MKALYRKGYRLCVAKQNLVEAWVVATRPRDANGFGHTTQEAAESIGKVKRLFHVLPERDETYLEWERLVVTHRVIGKSAHDARLVACMNVNLVRTVLTYNVDDFRRYEGILTAHPTDLR